jgi:hypothetical protein
MYTYPPTPGTLIVNDSIYSICQPCLELILSPVVSLLEHAVALCPSVGLGVGLLCYGIDCKWRNVLQESKAREEEIKQPQTVRVGRPKSSENRGAIHQFSRIILNSDS